MDEGIEDLAQLRAFAEAVDGGVAQQDLFDQRRAGARQADDENRAGAVAPVLCGLALGAALIRGCGTMRPHRARARHAVSRISAMNFRMSSSGCN